MSGATAFDEEELARRLAHAQNAHSLLPPLSVRESPADSAQAYAVQHRVLALRRQTVCGWKVGAKSATAPVQGAPLPADCLFPSPSSVRRSDFPTLGLELEIGFQFGRVFEPSRQPYAAADVLRGIGSMLPTIEVVTSRLQHWPAVDKLAQLADLQNHGALIVGEAIDYAADYPFESPVLSFRFDGIDIVKARPSNPAGDPRRLLVWLVNHATSRGIAIGMGDVITTGSYTGLYFPEQAGTAVGEISGFGSVAVTLV